MKVRFAQDDPGQLDFIELQTVQLGAGPFEVVFAHEIEEGGAALLRGEAGLADDPELTFQVLLPAIAERLGEDPDVGRHQRERRDDQQPEEAVARGRTWIGGIAHDNLRRAGYSWKQAKQNQKIRRR